MHARSIAAVARVAVVALAASSACARPPPPSQPEDVADARYYETVRVMEPYGRAAQPELQSVPALTNEIFECVVNEDCTLVDVGCRQRSLLALNRAHEDDATERLRSSRCEPREPTAEASCPDGDCDTSIVAVCDGNACAQLQSRSIGDTATEVTIVHSQLPPQPIPESTE